MKLLLQNPMTIVNSTKARTALLLAALCLTAFLPCRAAVPPPAAAPPVPAGYCTAINTELTNNLQAFNTQLLTPPTWTPIPGAPTIYGANLQWADSNTGPSLSNPNYMPTVMAQLQEFKAMGVQAVSVPALFPVLYEPFYGSQDAYQPYQAFYTQVAQAVRALGMTLIIDDEFIFSNDIAAGWSNVGSFYSSLTWPQYIAARAQNAATVVQTMQPDYIMLANEPDIEAIQTGQQNLNDPVQAAQMVAAEIAAIQALGLPNPPKMGAGFGTWMPTSSSPGLVDYLNAYLALPLDYLDFHLLPINVVNSNNFLNNSLTIASMAAAAGKPVAISQAWATKGSAGEWNVLSMDDLRARGPFSFWAPLDTYFLQTVQNLANYTQMIYVVPEFPVYLFSYQTYGGTDTNGGAANCTCTTASCSDGDIMQAENAAAAAADSTSQFTTTAFSYYNQLVTTPDTTPPSVPANLAATPAITQVTLTWNASTDDIGVAGYDIYRCSPPTSDQPCQGAWVATTTLPNYTDTPLTGNTWYTYQIQAFDLANNVSLSSQSVTVETFRSTADPATSPVATAISAQEIDLSWAPPSDQTGLEVYLVFGGTSLGNLQQITTRTQTNYKNLSLSPATTYYYGIIAVEDGINSAMTTVISATTLPLPNTPTAFTGTATSNSITLNWQETAVPGGLPISYYEVFEGTTAQNLTQIGTTTSTSYMVNSLTPGTTYYFAIVASDTQHDLSLASTTISVLTATLVAAPINVTPVANSATQVTVSWSEIVPTGALPVSSYTVFRGTSPTAMAQIAVRATTQFIDTTATAGTLYYYGVEATDTGHNVSAMSLLAPVTTPAMPAAPVNVIATANSATQITITWTENIPANGLPISSYSVFRGPSSTNLVKVTSRTGTSYIDTTALPNTTYYYAVQAVDSGKAVSAMSAVTQTATATTPAVPINVTVVATGATQFTVSWSEVIPSGGLPISSYNIFRGTTASNLTKLTARTASPFIDTGVTANTSYYYAVQAMDTGKDLSPVSNPVLGSPLSGLPAPVITSATAISGTQVTLNWTETVPQGGLPIASYNILRGTSLGGMTKVTSRTTTSFTDTGLTPNTTYYYEVQAQDTGHDLSPVSSPAQVATIPLPAAPANVVATANSGSQITLTWVENIPHNGLPVSSYTVYRGTSPSSLAQVAVRSSTSYIDTTASPTTTYYYAVTATDSGHDVSPTSGLAQTTTPALPAAPINLVAAATNLVGFISWIEIPPPNGLPVTSYSVYRGTSATNLAKVATRTGLTFNDTGLAPGTTYYYAVQAADSGKALSPMSAVVPMTTSN